MFKVDQVDLLAGGGDDDDEISLAESSELEPLSLSSSGSGSAFAAESPNESTGVSIFDPDAEDEADPSADTLVSNAISAPDINMDSAASGSGLAQLTLEPDDTSLGANLLEDVFGDESGDSAAGESAIGASAVAAAAGGALFESSGETDFGGSNNAAQAALMPIAEPYDGPWSGIAGGLALAMVVTLAVTVAATIMGLTGSGSAALLGGLDGSAPYMVMGGAAVHRREAEHLRIELCRGDLGFLGFAVAVPEEGDQTAEIVLRGGGVPVLAKGAAFAERRFEEAAVLARERGKRMLAEIAARHDGGGNAGDGEHLADGQRADRRRRATGQPKKAHSDNGCTARLRKSD